MNVLECNINTKVVIGAHLVYNGSLGFGKWNFLDYRPSFVYSPSFYKTMHFEHQIGLSLHYTFGDKKKLKKD